MNGYYLRPAETAKAMVYDRTGTGIGAQVETAGSDSWFRTGDMGKIDERGNVYVFGRADLDIIRSGAETIHAAEVNREWRIHIYYKELKRDERIHVRISVE